MNAYPTLSMTSPKLFYPSIDSIKFHNLVDQKITLNVKLKTHKNIDNAVDKFTTIIQTATWASQSKPTPTSTRNLLLPVHLRSLITDKRRAMAHYQISRLPSHKSLYNRLSNSLNNHFLKYKLDIFKQNLSNLSTFGGSLWMETNKLLQYKSSLPPLTKINNSTTITDENKAESIRQHLSEIFKPHPDINNLSLTFMRLALNARLRRVRTLLENKNHSRLKIKVFMYKTLLKPLRTYGLQLWGTAKVSNINKVQQFQNIALRKITNAPTFISNYTLNKDLSIKTVSEETTRFYKNVHARLQTHQNLLKDFSTQTLPVNPRRCFKRN
ncbi:Hypothetical protein CINCED_3A020171 [Cinara cedri]|uniref:Uncharacterized protein n=1 Tax=Cinara cedri TaxID=506608 RepID=A0A5E4NMU3_9HEMI|nr:Hypothetical protein CINCED_3A020171 [Cinara cedri]